MTELHVPAKRRLTPGDILPLAEYIPLRRERRRRVGALKRRRRVEVGPFATFYIENIETMRHQVQEMLNIEKGGEAQLADGLEAYNPLIPRDFELSATVMFEIDDSVRRAAALMQLGGIEHHAFIATAEARVRGVPHRPRKHQPRRNASSVQFLNFRLAPEEIAGFKTSGTAIVVGFDHPNYAHMAGMTEPVRAALA